MILELGARVREGRRRFVDSVCLRHVHAWMDKLHGVNIVVVVLI